MQHCNDYILVLVWHAKKVFEMGEYQKREPFRVDVSSQRPKEVWESRKKNRKRISIVFGVNKCVRWAGHFLI